MSEVVDDRHLLSTFELPLDVGVDPLGVLGEQLEPLPHFALVVPGADGGNIGRALDRDLPGDLGAETSTIPCRRQPCRLVERSSAHAVIGVASTLHLITEWLQLSECVVIQFDVDGGGVLVEPVRVSCPRDRYH